MINILAALRLWAKNWSGLTIKIHCDNEVVVSVLKSGKTSDSDLATISRNIFMICAKFEIFIFVEHILGKDNNITDLLYRWSDSKSDREIIHLPPLTCMVEDIGPSLQIRLCYISFVF